MGGGFLRFAWAFVKSWFRVGLVALLRQRFCRIPCSCRSICVAPGQGRSRLGLCSGAGVREILFSRRSISSAPVRGGTGWFGLSVSLSRAWASMESCFRVGLLALPLCGAAVTFFAAAKKVTKETAIPSLSTSGRPRHRTSHVVRQ